jgi:hypothetical protein
VKSSLTKICGKSETKAVLSRSQSERAKVLGNNKKNLGEEAGKNADKENNGKLANWSDPTQLML